MKQASNAGDKLLNDPSSQNLSQFLQNLPNHKYVLIWQLTINKNASQLNIFSKLVLCLIGKICKSWSIGPDRKIKELKEVVTSSQLVTIKWRNQLNLDISKSVLKVWLASSSHLSQTIRSQKLNFRCVDVISLYSISRHLRTEYKIKNV